MKIQKGIVKYKDRNDIVCTYGVTDDGRQYYFLDETDSKKFSNGNRIATTALVEAVDPMVKASNVGVIDNDGNVVVMFDNRTIKSVTDDVILVERAEPVSQSVIEALSLRSDPLSATKLVSTPATIKDRLNAQIGAEGRFIFNDQFSEATLCDINGNNLVNGEYYSFIAMTNDKIYMSKNTADSEIVELPITHVDVLDEAPTEAIDVSNVSVDQNVVEGALTPEGTALGDVMAAPSEDVTTGFNTEVQEGLVAPTEGMENTIVTDTMTGMMPVPDDVAVGEVLASSDGMAMDNGVTDVMSSGDGAFDNAMVSGSNDFGLGENAMTDPMVGFVPEQPVDINGVPEQGFASDVVAVGEAVTDNGLQSEFTHPDDVNFDALNASNSFGDFQSDVAVQDDASQYTIGAENNEFTNPMAELPPLDGDVQSIDVSGIDVNPGSLEEAFASEAVAGSDDVVAAVGEEVSEMGVTSDGGLVGDEIVPTDVTDSTGFELPDDVNAFASDAIPGEDIVPVEEGIPTDVVAEEVTPEDVVSGDSTPEEAVSEESVPEVAEDESEVVAPGVINDEDGFEFPPVVEENEPESEPVAKEDEPETVAEDDESANETVAEDEKTDEPVSEEVSEDAPVEPEGEDEVQNELIFATPVSSEEVAEAVEASTPEEEVPVEETHDVVSEKEPVSLEDVKFDDVIVSAKNDVIDEPIRDFARDNAASALTDLYDIPRDNGMFNDGYSRGRIDPIDRGYYDREPIESYGADVYSIPARRNTQYSMYDNGYDSVFQSSMMKPDRIVPSYNPFAGYKSPMIDSNSIMSDVARSMTELVRQNKEQRGTILQYQQQLESVEAQRRVLNEKYNDQTLRVESLSNKLRTLDDATNRLESKNQMLENRLRDQEKIIAAQERELNTLRPQLEGRQDLIKILADAKVLLGAEDEYQDDPYYGRRVA